MGQCMSRKAAGAFAASAAVSQNRPTKMQKHQKLHSPDDDNNKSQPQLITEDSNKHQHKTTSSTYPSRGVAMSFGFRRRTPVPSIAANATAARRLANNEPAIGTNVTTDVYDRNGNDASDTDALTSNAAPTGRSTPKLVPPKKEASATKVSRFGFRHTQTNRLNKVADVINSGETTIQNKNNNFVTKPIALSRTVVPTDNNNKNRMYKIEPPTQVGKFTLQTNQLPRPEPIRIIETKTAKTLANNNKRVAGMYQNHTEETSSKDGSLTEDSGVGSHFSSCTGEADVVFNSFDQFDSSPTFGARRLRTVHHKPRNLEVVATSNNTFDVRDMDDSNDSCDSVSAPPLPQLPSAFHSTPEIKNNSYHPSGIVRDRTFEYQRNLDRNSRLRKISKTSSDASNDEYGEEEKTYHDLFRNEKSFVRLSGPQPTFLKSRTNQLKGGDSSPPSSDEQEWAGGEAMADDVSFSMSSSDESKDKHLEEEEEQTVSVSPISNAVIGSALQSLMNSSLTKPFNPASKEIRNVMLTIEDPKFAAVAAASSSGTLLDDEILLSPVDSLISCSESEEIRRKLNRSSSNSKDINEKLTPPSPGTPTNASNSLSISDDNDNINNSAKDDFLIDDEIADQPDLLFEDSCHINNDNSSQTMMESTPKIRKRIPSGVEGSPLSIRHKKYSMHNRTGSLDTLSPCESIASDDLMMDFCYSQSSGLDEGEAHTSGYPSLNETLVYKEESLEAVKGVKDWNSISISEIHKGPEKHRRSTASRSRLLSSRVSTPNSTIDSHNPLARVTSHSSVTNSPARHNRIANISSSCGYDSDDSIRLDRTTHTAFKQDLVSMKTMLLKLKRTLLNETVEEELLRSDTHNPFESQYLTNGVFNSLCPDNDLSTSDEGGGGATYSKMMGDVSELRRQVLFLQGQLEDKEKAIQTLQNQMVRLADENYHANSAPASTNCESQSCNAATQTERIRPISAGPSLFNGSPVDGSAGSLVSATEQQPPTTLSPNSRRSRPPTQSTNSTAARQRSLSKLWRQPGEPPSPQRYTISTSSTSSSIPRRAHSRTRTPASTS